MSYLLQTLNKALSLKRPHNSSTTNYFTRWLSTQIENIRPTHYDQCGNLHVDMRHSAENRTLFTAHVDTVHHSQGKNSILKTRERWSANGDVLGADDGAGCAILLHMIMEGIPAYYIFTQGEEKGGIGSKFLAEHSGDLLKQFDRAIAFDRKATDSVITHQWPGRCCSDTFASALSDELNLSEKFMYSPDDSGVYTDTAEFISIIPECTNVSVGYYNEHSQGEYLDMIHFEDLARAVLKVNWDALPTERDPTVIDNYEDFLDIKNPEYMEFLEDALYDALTDSLYGYHRPLADLVSESIYPENPTTALKFIDTRKFTPRFINEMMGLISASNPDTILDLIFERTYRG